MGAKTRWGGRVRGRVRWKQGQMGVWIGVRWEQRPDGGCGEARQEQGPDGGVGSGQMRAGARWGAREVGPDSRSQMREWDQMGAIG